MILTFTCSAGLVFLQDTSSKAKDWYCQNERHFPIVCSDQEKSEYQPKTPRGKKLFDKRKKIIESGIKLLTTDEVLAEKAERRGELEWY